MTAPIIDLKPVLRLADLLAAGLRAAAADRITELRPALGPLPANAADRHRRELLLDEDGRRALAEHEEMVRLRAAAGRAWSEDRWADLAELARRYGSRLRLRADLIEAVEAIERIDAFPAAPAG
ncbi:hypothetical protein [Streptomyces sp. NRRL B-24484]|uniref:hypothetical protein n=1 Tax=Streptomyces sp. NRRL B-24484 TaxID=1463833 RepID=UPI0004C2062B|nr:hypothetical protein [Streptomyces sp. NRRL B-24484]